jgi:hypothetical protein
MTRQDSHEEAELACLERGSLLLLLVTFRSLRFDITADAIPASLGGVYGLLYSLSCLIQSRYLALPTIPLEVLWRVSKL